MLRQNKTKFGLGLVLILSIMATACPLSGSKGADKLRQAAKAEDSFAQGLKSTATILKNAETSGAISKEDVAVLKPYLKAAGEGNGQAIQITKSISSAGELPEDKQQQLVQIVTFISDQLTALNNEGTLRIKNPNMRAAFSAAVLAMQSIATSTIIIFVRKEN